MEDNKTKEKMHPVVKAILVVAILFTALVGYAFVKALLMGK